MNNPINNTVFDSRDLMEYREQQEQFFIDRWNEYFNGTDEEVNAT